MHKNNTKTIKFTEKQIQQIWNKAIIITDFDSTIYRKDSCGAWIIRSHYGERDSEYGWEIDHLISKKHGGNDEISNLRPLQWQNKSNKSGDVLVCRITSEKGENTEMMFRWN